MAAKHGFIHILHWLILHEVYPDVRGANFALEYQTYECSTMDGYIGILPNTQGANIAIMKYDFHIIQWLGERGYLFRYS